MITTGKVISAFTSKIFNVKAKFANGLYFLDLNDGSFAQIEIDRILSTYLALIYAADAHIRGNVGLGTIAIANSSNVYLEFNNLDGNLPSASSTAIDCSGNSRVYVRGSYVRGVIAVSGGSFSHTGILRHQTS